MTATPPAGVTRAALRGSLFPRRFVLLVLAFGVTIAAAVLAAAGYHFLGTREQAVQAAQENARNITRAVTDSVARTIQSVDIALASVGELLVERGFAGGEPLIAAALQQRLAFAPYLRQILVVDATGHVIYNTAPSGPPNINLTTLLPDLQRSVRPLVIGASRPGRFIGGSGGAGQRYIPLGRRVTGSNGELTGVVIATANPLYFEDIFDAIDLGPEARLRLWLFDGHYLTGDVPATGSAAKVLFEHLRNAEFGVFLASEDNSQDRIISYRTTLNWPLVVSVMVPLDGVLARWRSEVAVVGVPMAGLALGVLVLTAMLVATLLVRARQEEALRLSDRVLAGISNGVTIADATAPDNPLVYANAAFERITGYPVSAALGKNLRFLHGNDPRQPGLSPIRAALLSGGEATTVLQNLRADGRLFWNELTVSTVRDHTGRVTHYVGVQRDITAQKEAEEQLRSAYDEIARFNRDLERFAFVLAHHLQEPARLQAVFSERLVKLLPHPLAEEQAECLGHIRRGARHLRVLLQDVESYVTLDRQSVVGLCSADIALDVALRRLAVRCREVGVEVDRAPLGKVAMAEPRLAHLFGQLLDNALKYRDPQRALRISVQAVFDHGMCVISVTDNGVGMEPVYLDRIFLVFERLHAHHEFEGTGMGLALVHRMVEMAGGRIWVDSEPGVGSTFHFSLPAV